MSTHPVAEAIFHDPDDAVEAIERLLEAHVPAKDIDLTTGQGDVVPVRHRNHMAATALLGSVVGVGMAGLWLFVGASGAVDLPVMQSIIGTVGLVGAGLRLGFLGAAVGLVAGALGGLRTRVEAVDDRHVLDQASRIVVQLEQENAQAVHALRQAEPDRLMVVAS